MIKKLTMVALAIILFPACGSSSKKSTTSTVNTVIQGVTKTAEYVMTMNPASTFSRTMCRMTKGALTFALDNTLTGSMTDGWNNSPLELFGSYDEDTKALSGWYKDSKNTMVYYTGQMVNSQWTGTWYDTSMCSGTWIAIPK